MLAVSVWQKDDGLGGSHKGRTASIIPKDDYVENKSSSDHMGGSNFQSSQDGGCDNDNSEFLPENEEERQHNPSSLLLSQDHY